MPTQVAAYTKKQVYGFLGAFYICAILCLVTVLQHSSAVPDELATPPRLYSVIIGFAVVLPLLLLFDAKVRRIRPVFYGVMHFVAGLTLMFYVGTYSPMIAIWLILCIITYLELGFVSFVAGSAFLYIVMATFLLLVRPILPPDFIYGLYVFYSVAFCSAMVLTGYIMTRVIDASKRRQIELEKVRKSELEQLGKVNTLLNSITDAILTLDADLRVTSQNAAALGFFDTNESLVGKQIMDILKITDEKSEQIDVQKLIKEINKNTLRDDVMMPNGDQGTMRLSLQLSPIYGESERQGTVLVIRDITKQKTLEDEKDEFISVASHELRTPIAVAEASISNLVIMQEKGLDPAKLKSAATTAHEEIVYLAGVVNDLSTLSRAERGVADMPEPVDLTQLFHDMYTKYEPQAAKKSLKLNLDLESQLPVVEVSRLYIEEILQNFLTNALKYTKEGTVTLIAKVVDGGVRCAVSDTGIGISKSDQNHLGEKFFRSEDYRTRETNGTGLGLYVVQKLALKIGTKIEVESRLNHGSVFSLVVPLKSSVHSTGKRSSLPLPES